MAVIGLNLQLLLELMLLVMRVVFIVQLNCIVYDHSRLVVFGDAALMPLSLVVLSLSVGHLRERWG